MILILPILATLVLFVAIVWACTVFTNAIEWLGHRFNLSQGAVGSVLAAVGTAMPETIVPIVALVGGALAGGLHQAQSIGIGAILGAPFLLSTLAMCVTGVAVFYGAWRGRRGLMLNVNTSLLKRDLVYFFIAYGVVFLAAWIHIPAVSWSLAGFLLVLYGVYVYRTLTLKADPQEAPELEPLLLLPKSTSPPSWLIWGQALLGIVVIVVFAHLFVEQIKHLSTLLSLPPLILSLLIVPIATELPEKFNSVTWILKQKDHLALSNVTGAMVFQSCIPASVGLIFTPWILDSDGLVSMLLCFTSAGLILLSMLYRQKLSPVILLMGGVFYLVFLFRSIVEISHR